MLNGIPLLIKIMVILKSLFEFFGNVGSTGNSIGPIGGSSYDNSVNNTNSQRSLSVSRLIRKVPKPKPLPFKFNIKKYLKTHK